MANDLTNFLPKWLAKAQSVLRGNTVMPFLVNTDFSMKAEEKGNTVNVPLPASYSATDITPGVTSQANADTDPDNVQISLSYWRGVKFAITDKELSEIEASDSFVPRGLDGAAKAIAEDVNTKLFAEYKGVYGYVGTAGTTPFATTVAAATSAKKTLTDQECPPSDRRAVLDTAAMANALNLSAFSGYQNSGDADVITEGKLGRKFGFQWYEDQDVPTHTLGAAGTILVDQADVAIGDTALHIDGATTKPSVGDVFTVAGDTQTYTVLTASDLATTDCDITFYPPAKVAWADDAALTFKASHVVNLAFHRDAFAFVARPLVGNVQKLFQMLGANNGQLLGMRVMQDPVTGIPLRLSIVREYMQTALVLDLLYGVKLLRPELAARIAG
jgi:hypothetical protein